jgi:excisionase family DNA binding protein
MKWYTVGKKGGGMTEQLFTTTEAGGLLKVHPETIRNWIRRGELAAIRVGRSWRIKRVDLERIAEQGTVEPGRVKEAVQP